jgi:hypothetical protein
MEKETEMRKATKVCILVTIAIVLCLLLIPSTANVDISPALSGIGIFFLAGIPSYILYRKYQSEKEDRRIWCAIEDLAKVERNLDKILKTRPLEDLKTQLGIIRANLHPRGLVDEKTYWYIIENP